MDFSEIEKSFNIKISFGSAKYDCNGGAKYTVEVSPVVNGRTISKEAIEFQTYCQLYGLEKSDMGKTFFNNGETFKITGLSSRSRKFPIFAERIKDGKEFKFTPESVKIGLGRQMTVPSLSSWNPK